MSLFLTTFFLLYGGLHAYVFLKVKAAFPLGMKAHIIIILFMVFMILAPVFVSLLEKAQHESIARTIAYTGYTWMAAIFILFVILLIFDIIHLFIWMGCLIVRKNMLFFSFASLHILIIAIISTLCIITYGYFEAQTIRVNKILIESKKMAKELNGFTIVQISDVHLGLIVREKRLQAIIEKVKEAKPHVLVSTGDLVDGQIDNLSELITLLRAVNPPYGKYAITGNHEFYAGLNNAVTFYKKTGFKLLRGEAITIPGIMNIAGVDDPAGKAYGLYRNISEKELLSNLPEELFTVFLKHRPEVNSNSTGLFDLQLSGHTHKGQIFPFRYITRIFFPMYSGFFNLGQGSSMYASKGSGTWGPPIRFLAPPEITVIYLTHKES